MDFKMAGAVALRQGDIEEAERCYNAAVAGNVRDWESIAALASLYLDRNMTGVAFALFRDALNLEMDARVLADIGRVMVSWGQYEAALAHFEKAHEVDPKNVPAMNNAAMACTNLNRIDDAAAWLTKARTNLDKFERVLQDYRDVDRNWSFVHLMRQDWKEGWEAFDLGVGRGDRIERNFGPKPLPRWTPDMPSSEKVVIYGEQGIGDELLFATCVPDVLTRCDNVIIETMPRLVGVFSRSFPWAKVYGTRYEEHPHWVEYEHPTCRTSVAQLPRWFRNTTESFPGKPYVVPNPQMASMVRGLLKDISDKPKVGIAWSGGTALTGWADRQVPLAHMASALATQDVELISLMHTLGDEYPEDYGVHVFPQITHRELDYEWTMALISELDAVVSVPTAAAHAGGAVGTKTLVLRNPHPQWRWGGATMPWWNSVEVLHDWSWESASARLGEVLAGG